MRTEWGGAREFLRVWARLREWDMVPCMGLDIVSPCGVLVDVEAPEKAVNSHSPFTLKNS